VGAKARNMGMAGTELRKLLCYLEGESREVQRPQSVPDHVGEATVNQKLSDRQEVSSRARRLSCLILITRLFVPN
jgi:hypothetical protein